MNNGIESRLAEVARQIADQPGDELTPGVRELLREQGELLSKLRWSEREWSPGDPTPNLNAALAKAQGQMEGAKKDALNPAFMREVDGKRKASAYADLASVITAIREAFSANGIAYPQTVLCDANGVTVTTHLLHASGESMSSPFWVPVMKKDPQGYGSATTYARRFGLMALAGVAAEDDDGNSHSADPRVQAAETTPAPRPTQAETVAKLVRAFDALGVSVGQLEERLGHSLSSVTDAEIADLRAYHAKKKEVAAGPDEAARLEVQKQAEASLAKADVTGSTPQSEAQTKALLTSSIFAATIDKIRAASTEVDVVAVGATFATLGLPPGEMKAIQRTYTDKLLVLKDKAKEAKRKPRDTGDDVPR